VHILKDLVEKDFFLRRNIVLNIIDIILTPLPGSGYIIPGG
jgi:hypothetical protein